MNLRDLYTHVTTSMVEIRKEYHDIEQMIKNAETEGIDYKDWPQYAQYLGMKAKWAVYREIKEMLSNVLDSEY